jgi:DNA-binding transcriptional MerR regulator
MRIVPISEAAKAVGLSEWTIRRYVRLGLLKKYRTPTDRRTYVDLEALEELRRNPPFHTAN